MPLHVIAFGFGFCAGGIIVCALWQRNVDHVREIARDAIAEAKAQRAADALNGIYRPRPHVRDGALEAVQAPTDEEAWRRLEQT